MSFVCVECVGEEGLQEFIKDNAESKECTFCSDSGDEPRAADVALVTDHFRACVETEYDAAGNSLGWDNAEGGYQGQHWDSYDLVRDELELEFPNDVEDELFQVFVDCLDDIVWCQLKPYSLSPMKLGSLSWNAFCQVVKHERRFFFREHEEQDRELFTASTVLTRIVEYAETLQLLVDVGPETPLYRAREHCPDRPWTTAQDLGPPPEERAKQNRMSPAGIPMLYVSQTPGVALRELRAVAGNYSIGDFRLEKPTLLLDLTEIPPVPSLFLEFSDTLEYYPRPLLAFLHSVAYEMSQSVTQDDRVHIEYVPTQIVTEFVRSRTLSDGRRVKGIRYRSSVGSDHWSAVLFATQREVVNGDDGSQCEEPSNQWIRLRGTDTRDL
jgi:hypothetical protein